MIIWRILLLIGILIYIAYGIVKTIKNKDLSLLHKIVWVSVIILLPILGTSAYLKTTFTQRH